MDTKTIQRVSSRREVLLNTGCLGLINEEACDGFKPRCVVFVNIDYLVLVGSET